MRGCAQFRNRCSEFGSRHALAVLNKKCLNQHEQSTILNERGQMADGGPMYVEDDSYFWDSVEPIDNPRLTALWLLTGLLWLLAISGSLAGTIWSLRQIVRIG
jgi:hypothetical protein